MGRPTCCSLGCVSTAIDPDALNRLSHRIIEAAIEIHSRIGPGLLEAIYRACMIYELRAAGLTVMAEQLIPIKYKDLVLDGCYRLDLSVEDQVVVELKSIENVLPVPGSWSTPCCQSSGVFFFFIRLGI